MSTRGLQVVEAVLEVAAEKVGFILKREKRGAREEREGGVERLGWKRNTAEEAMDSACCVCGCGWGTLEGLRLSVGNRM